MAAEMLVSQFPLWRASEATRMTDGVPSSSLMQSLSRLCDRDRYLAIVYKGQLSTAIGTIGASTNTRGEIGSRA